MSTRTVFVLQHESSSEDVKLIGVYRSRADAVEARDRAAALPGFREGGEFTVDPYELGQDHWTSGFRTVEREARVGGPRAA
jgi:hypothetical protein